jgi:hypothetical protein
VGRIDGPRTKALHDSNVYRAILVLSGIAAPSDDRDPAPIWPEDGRVPPKLSHQYVFLTRDKHAVVVLAPERPEIGIDGPKRPIRVPLRNEMVPSVRVSVTRAAPDRFLYRYTTENGSAAADPIGSWSLIFPAEDQTIKTTPAATGHRSPWPGTPAGAPIAKHPLFPAMPPGRVVLWFHQTPEDFVKPGKSLIDFSVQSSFLPGLTTAWFSTGELLNIDQSWPREIMEQLAWLDDRRWRDKYVITAGPVFAPNTPREVIAESVSRSVKAMVGEGWLSTSSAFTAQTIHLLEKLRLGQHEVLAPKFHPSTETEEALYLVLQLSLQVRLPDDMRTGKN